MTPRGDALPQTTHGRYSKVFPSDLSALGEKVGKDKDLLDLSEEIDALDLRVAQIFNSIESGEGQNAWRDLKRGVKDLRKAEMSGDARLLQRSLVDIMAAVDEGQKLPAAWDEVTKLFDLRRRLVDSEAKRRDKIAESVKVEQLVLMFRELGMSLRNNVLDESLSREKALQNIVADMNRYLGEVRK